MHEVLLVMIVMVGATMMKFLRVIVEAVAIVKRIVTDVMIAMMNVTFANLGEAIEETEVGTIVIIVGMITTATTTGMTMMTITLVMRAGIEHIVSVVVRVALVTTIAVGGTLRQLDIG